MHITKKEVDLLCHVVGLMYREGGSAAPRPEGWTEEEWETRKNLYGRLMIANRPASKDDICKGSHKPANPDKMIYSQQDAYCDYCGRLVALTKDKNLYRHKKYYNKWGRN